ncbi:MAG: MCE family protein [Planctomycetaceae bacterium]|nr:MCE family protein [Planctomycetaceae bacterium]
MSNSKYQFRVGLFVILATVIGIGLTFQFGKLERYLQPRYMVAVHFEEISGIQPGTPVRQSGIPIGIVKDVTIDRDQRKIFVLLELKSKHQISNDSQPHVVNTLLGESHIEFTLGLSSEFYKEGDILEGKVPQDPLAIVQRIESRLDSTLEAFEQTSQEWKLVGHNVNSLITTKQGSLDQMIEQAGSALNELTSTMRKASITLDQANKIVADPELQASIKQSMQALPRLMQQTESLIQQTSQTIASTKKAVDTMGTTMENLRVATQPLADNSNQLMTKFDTGLTQLNHALSELDKFSTQLNQGEGSLQKLATDPQLYRNLQLSSASLASLLSNLEPIVQDMQVFSDKIARHPELLGVSGYLKGSSGLKDSTIQPASSTAPAALRNANQSGNSINLRIKR